MLQLESLLTIACGDADSEPDAMDLSDFAHAEVDLVFRIMAASHAGHHFNVVNLAENPVSVLLKALELFDFLAVEWRAWNGSSLVQKRLAQLVHYHAWSAERQCILADELLKAFAVTSPVLFGLAVTSIDEALDLFMLTMLTGEAVPEVISYRLEAALSSQV